MQANGYEARTDGSSLEVRRTNGVVVGEGRIGVQRGGFCVNDYIGELDEQLREAVQALLEEHETDIVARLIANGRHVGSTLS